MLAYIHTFLVHIVFQNVNITIFPYIYDHPQTQYMNDSQRAVTLGEVWR